MTKSFQEFIDIEEGEEVLEEGFVRTSAITSYAARSKAAGDKSHRAFESGRSALRGDASTKSIEGRLARLEKALDAMLEGSMHQRVQIGNALASNVAGHLIASGKRTN